MLAGEPESSGPSGRRGTEPFSGPAAPPADIVVVGNHPWPGDPMQSFKVLLHHRAACKPGGVLAGLFWTDADEIDRSFPRAAMSLIAATGRRAGGGFADWSRSSSARMSAAGSPSAFMLRWARELVVDRTVMVYSPPLHARIGPRLGPVRVFAEQRPLWEAALAALGKAAPTGPVRLFPQGGLTYVAHRGEQRSTGDSGQGGALFLLTWGCRPDVTARSSGSVRLMINIHSKNRPTITWKSPRTSGNVNASSGPSCRGPGRRGRHGRNPVPGRGRSQVTPTARYSWTLVKISRQRSSGEHTSTTRFGGTARYPGGMGPLGRR